jgi:hypothetical protein
MVFTAVLAGSTIALWYVTKRSVDLAKKEFVATHRPRITVHTFEVSSNEHGHIGAVFTYVNSGGTPATINEIAHNIFFSDGLRPGASMKERKLESKTLAAGEQTTFLIDSETTEESAVVARMRADREQRALDLLCVGRIKYTDTQKIVRETGFCRRYDTKSRIWVRVDNSDYEYFF